MADVDDVDATVVDGALDEMGDAAEIVGIERDDINDDDVAAVAGVGSGGGGRVLVL